MEMGECPSPLSPEAFLRILPHPAASRCQRGVRECVFLERTRHFQRLRTTAGLKVRHVGFAKCALRKTYARREIGVGAQLASRGKNLLINFYLWKLNRSSLVNFFAN